MHSRLSDTDLDAERAQLDLLRRAPLARRASLVWSLSRFAIRLARRGLDRMRPEGSGGEDARVRFIALHYGQSLAASAGPALSRSETVPDPDLLAALTPVVEAFEALGVRYYIGGSVASSAHGMPRATLDVDVVAELRPEHVGTLVERFARSYYVDEARVRAAVARRRSFNLIHLATALKIDVFVSKGRPFDREALRRARQEALEESAPARRFFVASPEDVILAKLEWYRAGGEASERQWRDVVGILKAAGPALDHAYLARWAPALHVADLLDRALADATGR